MSTSRYGAGRKATCGASLLFTGVVLIFLRMSSAMTCMCTSAVYSGQIITTQELLRPTHQPAARNQGEECQWRHRG